MHRLRPRWSRIFVVGAVSGIVSGCAPERPPAPTDNAPTPTAEANTPQISASFTPGTDEAVLTFAGERGKFTDSSSVDDVPEPAQGLVRVTLIGGQRPPAGTVWVANLGSPRDDGSFELKTVQRDLFEELALGQGLSSQAELPDGLEPPTEVATADGIIVYKTSWCGVCKKVEDYLKRKGATYEAKDIEADRSAAAELAAKTKAAGTTWKGSVPVIDIGGELIVGFNRAKMEKLLAG